MPTISHAARDELGADAAVRQLYARHARACPRERYARHDLNVFEQLRAWRQAEQQQSLAAEALDDLLTRYGAVNATRGGRAHDSPFVRGGEERAAVNMVGVVLGAIAAAAVFTVLFWSFAGTFNGCCPAPRCHHQPWMYEHKHLWFWTRRRWRTCGRRSYARKSMPRLMSEITEELAKR